MPVHLASLHRQLRAAVRAAVLAWMLVFAVTCVFIGTLGASGVAHAGQERWDKLATPLFQHLGLDQGLPHPVGMALAQDGDGYIWIGTQSGLARWDGYQVRSFSHNAALSTSLPGDFIQTLHVDHAGRLWVGSAAAGLALYDKSKEQFVRPHEELSRGAINAIASDSKGNLWVGTPAALKFYDAAAGTVSSYTHENSPGLPDNQIRALLFDRAGNLWIGTGKGLARLRPGGAIVTVQVSTGAQGQWQDAVLALAENRQGQIGFGTLKSGVGMANPQRDSARLLSLSGVHDMDAHMVLALAEIAPDRWWATTYGGGIVEYHTDGSRTSATRIVHQPAVGVSISHDRTAALLRDRSGLVWVTTERGVDFYDPHSEAIDSVFGAEGQLEAGVTALMTDSHNDVWIALADQGVDMVAADGSRHALLRPDPHRADSALPNRMILSMEEATPGEAWIGTQLGLYLTSKHGSRVRRIALPEGNPYPRVGAIAQRDGELWLGTFEGLVRYQPASGAVQRYVQGAPGSGGLTDNRIHALAFDAYGALWIATRNGLNRLEPSTGQVEQIVAAPNISTALSDPVISALVIDGRGRLWVGTLGGGICVLTGRDSQGKPVFERVGQPEALANATIMTLQADPTGRIWAATSDSVAVIEANTLKARILTRADGLAFRTFFIGASTVTAENDMIFGSTSGMAVIYPGQLSDWNFRPPLVIGAVRVDQQPVTPEQLSDTAVQKPGQSPGKTLTVQADSQSFEVELAALDFSAPKSNRYAYMLEGFDAKWIEVDANRRIASYTHLPAGDYTLRLRGSNRQGMWSADELSLRVLVLPPWQQTWWAWLIYFLVTGVLSWALVRWRVRHLHHRGEVLQALVYSRTQHLEKLNAIVRSVNEQTDFDALLHTMLHESTVIKGIDSALALVREDGSDQLSLRAAWGSIDAAADGYRIDLRQADQRYAPPSCMIAPDIFEIHVDGAVPGAVCAMLTVRVVIDGQVEGYLIFENYQYQATFAATDIDLLKALKEPFVSAYQKARGLRMIERARLNAEAATRAKSEFLANISHEIRTPMNAILGFAGLGTHLDLAPQPLDYFRKIGRAGQSLLEIINDVLDFSKIESGKLELEALPFDLPDTLNQLADLFSWRAAERGLELVIWSTPEVPPTLLGDPLRLSQILVNLVGNALKFTASGHIELRVEPDRHAHNVAAGAVALRFTVEDSGVGISSEQQARLFQAFAQADVSTTRVYGGTGLGLAISQQLVRKMGGVISVDSEPGVGSSFSFAVQLQRAPEQSQRLQPVPAAAQGKRVLVVDDCEAARHMLRTQLNALGLNASGAVSGPAAVALMQQNAYDVLLIDADMPDIDGIETLQRIAEDPELAAVPAILMLSAYQREHNPAAASQVGDTPILDKPSNPYLLRSAVLTALGIDAGQNAPKLAPPPSFAIQRIRGAHVLVVDDNSINQQVANDILQRAGVRCDLASSGEEAARMVNDTRYDAVLMDIQMPEMDGYQATALIRADERHTTLPIIAMTAHAVAGYRERCLNMDMNDYVTKPINPETLYTVLAAWVAPDPARTVSAAPEQAALQVEAPAPPTSAAEPAAPAALVVPGIDMAAALDRLGGHSALLMRLLGMFAKDFDTYQQQIQDAIESGQLLQAAELVHKVRGAAGNISATELFETATALEDRLRAEHHDVDGLLAAFSHALALVLAGALEEIRKQSSNPT